MAVLSLAKAATTPVLTDPSFAGVTFGLGMLTFTGFLLTTAAFIVWLFQARENLDLRGATGLTWSKGWAIGGWFVPLANFVIPVLVVAEVYRRSDDAGRARGIPALVGAWWAMLVLSAFRFTITTMEAGRPVVHFVSFWHLVNGIAGVAAAVLAMRLVDRVTTWQAGWQPAPTVGVTTMPG
jgi:hypothetical protein